jgi:nickel-dependent lactate racemase
MILLQWQNEQLKIPISGAKEIRVLEPLYPPPLNFNELKQIIINDLSVIAKQIRLSKTIALIIEDSSRITDLIDFLAVLIPEIEQIRNHREGIMLIIAAGAHYNLSPKSLKKKYGSLPIPYLIHDATKDSELNFVGDSRSGIPLFFNKSVVEADLRISLSTLNIHPLLGFSGGAKILLPGVAGLETINAFHSLPRGNPGVYQNPMRLLLDEVEEILPIEYTWQLLSRYDGKIIKVFNGNLDDAQKKGIEELKKIVTVTKPKSPADLIIAGAVPFNQNLIGSFKALPQLVKLVRHQGVVILFNEAPQGVGDHYWRLKPKVISEQKNYYRQLFQNQKVIVFSPATNEESFRYLFPDGFILLRSFPNLVNLINSQTYEKITFLPYAPLTLIED